MSDKKEIYTALIKAQGEMGIAIPDDKGQRKEFCTVKALREAADDALRKHGLGINFAPTVYDGKLYMVGVLMHTSGQDIRASMPYIPDPGMQNPLQGYGSAQSYTERYLYRALTGVTIQREDQDPDKTPVKDNKASDEPKITKEQYDHLTALLRKHDDKTSLHCYNNIIKFNKVNVLMDLPARQFSRVESYIKNFKKEE